MISEILDILANLSNLPSKESKPKDSKKDFTVFICYFISATCFIFIIPEFEEIRKLENSFLFVSLYIVISICLTFPTLLLLKKLNIIKDLIFSTFVTLAITIFLFFNLIIYLVTNNIIVHNL